MPPKAKRDSSLEKRAMENRTSRKCGAQNDSEGLRRAKEEAGPSPIRALRVWAQDDNENKKAKMAALWIFRTGAAVILTIIGGACGVGCWGPF